MSGTKIAGDALISALSFAEHSCLQLMSDGVAAHLPVMNYYLPCWLSRLLLSTRAARVRTVRWAVHKRKFWPAYGKPADTPAKN